MTGSRDLRVPGCGSGNRPRPVPRYLSEEPRRKATCSQKEKKLRDETRNMSQPKFYTDSEFKN